MFSFFELTDLGYIDWSAMLGRSGAVRMFGVHNSANIDAP